MRVRREFAVSDVSLRCEFVVANHVFNTQIGKLVLRRFESDGPGELGVSSIRVTSEIDMNSLRVRYEFDVSSL